MRMVTRRGLIAGAGAGLGLGMTGLPAILRAQGPQPIRVGEINSYTTLPAFTLPYRKGAELAIAEINDAGGVLGRPLAAIFRDDAGKPEDAVRLASELVNAEQVDLLAGTFFSHIGLAVSAFALQNKRFFMAAEPLTDAIVWSQGHRYTFRLRPSTYMQCAMLVEEAAALPAKRWAIVAPNYEYGQSAAKWFKELLAAKRPDVSFVVEQYPAQGRIDAAATVQALAAAKPEAIFNVTFGADLTNFVRQGNARGLFDGRAVVSLLTGEPEYLDPLGEETPEGWIVTGYPWADIQTPEHVRFRDAYQARFKDHPRQGSIVGYAAFKAIAAAITAAGSTDQEKLVAATKGLELGTPFGPIQFRASDHQSTLGAYVGRLTRRGGKGVMTGWRYADGKDYLPDDEAVKRLRPAG